ncbi:MAG: ribulose 1,5-bisphosphate carboxylase, partial [Mesorhizobium sp.]
MIILTYRIETSGSIEAMAAKIASDQSTGTFVALPGETEELKARVAAHVLAIRHLPDAEQPSIPDAGPGPFKRADVDIGFPFDAIGTDLAALMTIAIGGTYSIRGFSGIRVVDMKLPKEFRGAHPGHETAAMVGELIDAGIDFIKDDEKLMSPAYSPLAERVKAIMPLILNHEQKTGKKVMYAFGISHADPDQMMRNHDLVVEAGGNCAVININSIGFGGMAYLRKRSGLVLHAHRNGWDILTRHPG